MARRGASSFDIRLKRAYEPAEPSDGMRILMERLWPRGLSREKARVDLWLKELAPSTDLRKWFGHDPLKWDEFRRRYHRELQGDGEALGVLREAMKKGKVTFVFGSREERWNAAVALREFVEGTRRKE